MGLCSQTAAGGSIFLAHDNKFALAPFSCRILFSYSVAFSSLLFSISDVLKSPLNLVPAEMNARLYIFIHLLSRCFCFHLSCQANELDVSKHCGALNTSEIVRPPTSAERLLGGAWESQPSLRAGAAGAQPALRVSRVTGASTRAEGLRELRRTETLLSRAGEHAWCFAFAAAS